MEEACSVSPMMRLASYEQETLERMAIIHAEISLNFDALQVSNLLADRHTLLGAPEQCLFRYTSRLQGLMHHILLYHHHRMAVPFRCKSPWDQNRDLCNVLKQRETSEENVDVLM